MTSQSETCGLKFRMLHALHSLPAGEKGKKILNLLFKQTLGSCFTQSGAYESCLACHTLSPIIVSGLFCN